MTTIDKINVSILFNKIQQPVGELLFNKNKIYFKYDQNFIESNLKEIIYAFEYHSSFVNRALVAAFEQEFKDNFQIREPRYGFGGFDKGVFNDTLVNEGIPEIEDAIEKGQK
jgi:hypothetical protein